MENPTLTPYSPAQPPLVGETPSEKPSAGENTDLATPIQEYFLTKSLPGLADRGAAELHLTNLGATIMGFRLPLASGPRDVILGFAQPADYLVQEGNLGAVVGRVAGRIPAGPEGYPSLRVDGQTYRLSANAGTTCLHGGEPGFHRQVWELEDEGQDDQSNWLSFRLVSADGDAGFPGDLEAHVRYSLETPTTASSLATDPASSSLENPPSTAKSEYPSTPPYIDLRISYQASCSQPTVCSLTQHAYFNLAGHASGHLLGQELQISASQYTDFTEDLIATGQICSLENTLLDLRSGQDLGQLLRQGLGQVAPEDPTRAQEKSLASKTDQASPTGTRLYLQDIVDPHLDITRGLDHNYILHQEAQTPLQKVACLSYADLSMEVWTTFPGLQVYTANYLDTLGKPGQDGQPAAYPPHSAVCLECQAWPNAVNLDKFPSVALEPGQVYQQETIYRFHLA